MKDSYLDLNVGTIILATGFKDFDTSLIPELGYGKLDNVLTSMEFERLINASGPTSGKVTLKNGQPPKSVAIVHCFTTRASGASSNRMGIYQSNGMNPSITSLTRSKLIWSS